MKTWRKRYGAERRRFEADQRARVHFDRRVTIVFQGAHYEVYRLKDGTVSVFLRSSSRSIRPPPQKVVDKALESFGRADVEQVHRL